MWSCVRGLRGGRAREEEQAKDVELWMSFEPGESAFAWSKLHSGTSLAHFHGQFEGVSLNRLWKRFHKVIS